MSLCSCVTATYICMNEFECVCEWQCQCIRVCIYDSVYFYACVAFYAFLFLSRPPQRIKKYACLCVGGCLCVNKEVCVCVYFIFYSFCKRVKSTCILYFYMRCVLVSFSCMCFIIFASHTYLFTALRLVSKETKIYFAIQNKKRRIILTKTSSEMETLSTAACLQQINNLGRQWQTKQAKIGMFTKYK